MRPSDYMPEYDMSHDTFYSYPSFVAVHLALVAFCTYVVISSLPRVRQRFVAIMLFSGMGLIHGLVPLATPSYLFPPLYDPSSRLLAAQLALLSVLAIWAGWRTYERLAYGSLPHGATRTTWQPPSSKRVMRRVLYTCAILGPSAFLVQIHFSGGTLLDSMTTDRFAFRGSGQVTLAAMANHAVGLAVLPGFLGFFLDRWSKIFGIAFGLSLMVMLFVFTQGERAIPLGVFGGMVAGYLLSNRLSPRRFLIVCLALIVLLAGAISLYRLRHIMSQATFSESVDVLVSWHTYEEAITEDPLNYHEMFVLAVDNFPNRHEFLWGATYRRILFFLLPSSQFPHLKPHDTNVLFANVIRPEHVLHQLTVPPTIPGDAYINFGPLGVLVLFPTGMLLAWGSRQLMTKEIWFLALAPSLVRLMMVGLRGQPYEVCVTIIGLLGCLSILHYLLLFAQPLNSHVPRCRQVPRSLHVDTRTCARTRK
jgi:oligosaccharide repeat unit polymerase